jgi:hypothetical protein
MWGMHFTSGLDSNATTVVFCMSPAVGTTAPAPPVGTTAPAPPVGTTGPAPEIDGANPLGYQL